MAAFTRITFKSRQSDQMVFLGKRQSGKQDSKLSSHDNASRDHAFPARILATPTTVDVNSI